jgi:hypothetical protein
MGTTTKKEIATVETTERFRASEAEILDEASATQSEERPVAKVERAKRRIRRISLH